MLARIGLLFGGLMLSTVIVTPGVAQKEVGKAPPAAIMFGGSPARNLANTTDKNIPADWSVDKGKEKNVLWKTATGNQTYGGPIVADGKVFVGTNNARPRDAKVKGDRGVIMCFDEKSGDFLWQIVHNKGEKAIDETGCGIASTPAVENGKLYYVSNRCELVCAETTKGTIVWSLDMIKDLKVYPGGISGGLPNGSPLILDDLVIASTSNGVDAETQKPKSPEAPSLVAVNKTTGKVVWTDASPGNDIMDGQWTSPAAAKIDGKWQVIFAGGDGWLRGLDAKTGQLVWKFDCNPKGLKFAMGDSRSKNYFVALPVVYDNKVYVAVGMEPDSGNGVGHLWCVDPAKKPTNKALDLSPVDNNFDPKAPVNKDSGLVWHVGGEIMPPPADNSRPYHFSRTVSTVAIHDGIVYAAELTGYLLAFDAVTGKKYWSYDLKDATWSSPYYADGKVYIGNDSGDMYVFAAGKEAKLLGKVDMGQSLKTPPHVANGVLYISNGLYLFAIK